MTHARDCTFMVIAVAAASGIPGIAAAKPWQVCDAQIKVVSHDVMLLADVLKVTPRGADKDISHCGVPMGQRIHFTPATADYQHDLPRARWPRRGAVALLRHRYLDGECMGDGHPHPCRIEHFSVLS